MLRPRNGEVQRPIVPSIAFHLRLEKDGIAIWLQMATVDERVAGADYNARQLAERKTQVSLDKPEAR